MRHELFVYYRASALHAEALGEAVHQMQQCLKARHIGLEARLMRRADSGEGDPTWMETYRLPLKADPARLAEAIAEAAQVLRPLIVGERHVEHFFPCAS
jgi:hypothetical protein